MSDIVERLRYFPPGSCEYEAADEIERLKTTLQQYADRMTEYVKKLPTEGHSGRLALIIKRDVLDLLQDARAELEGKP